MFAWGKKKPASMDECGLKIRAVNGQAVCFVSTLQILSNALVSVAAT
jgi:hypothetical protein